SGAGGMRKPRWQVLRARFLKRELRARVPAVLTIQRERRFSLELRGDALRLASPTHAGIASLRSCFAAFAIYGDLHMCRDFAMQLNRHVEFAEALQRIVEVNLASIDIEAFALECRGDVCRRHRTKKVILLADFALECELHVIELLRKRFGSGLFFGGLAHGSGFHLLDDGFIGAACFDSKFARQKEVAAISFGDLHDLAAMAELFDIFFEND